MRAAGATFESSKGLEPRSDVDNLRGAPEVGPQ